MLIERLVRPYHLTPTEQELARYLLAHANQVRTLSTQELALRAHASKSTVTRLCRKLGCASYREFQAEFDREQAELARIRALLSDDPVRAHASVDEVVRIVQASSEKDVRGGLLGLDRQLVARAVRRISSARKVDLYGSGVALAIAELTAFKLSTLDIECSVHSGLNEHYVLADRHPEQKAVVMFSLTGGNPNMVYIARFLQGRGYYVLGIGGDEKDALAPLCTDYLRLHMGENILGMEIVRALNLVNTAVDVIFTALLAADYDRNRAVASQLLEQGA